MKGRRMHRISAGHTDVYEDASNGRKSYAIIENSDSGSRQESRGTARHYGDEL